MIEKIVFDYLTGALDVPVLTEMPAEKFERYVLIEKTGGSIEDFIHKDTIAIQSYAESRYNAAALNECVKDAMDRIVELPTIGKVQLNSDYNFSDTTRKKYRYQAIYELTY